jgi:antitoxin ParD1/3/4
MESVDRRGVELSVDIANALELQWAQDKPRWNPRPSGKTMLGQRLRWRKDMNLDLPAEANDFVKSLVAQGKYQSEEDAVVDGIRLLKGREELRAKMAVGIDQLDRGESLGEEAVFDEVEAEIRRIESLRNQE